jgi:queuine tRNA-ribosyltransferase
VAFSFQVLGQDKNTSARRGVVSTSHGVIQTPVFMSVGTFGSVRALDHVDLESIGVQIILGNTYHLYLRPGALTLQQRGGYHNLIHWNAPILTDSGGFQIFSLPHQRVISEQGVEFKSYIDQAGRFFSPESNIAFQETIGSDIMMVLDVCVPSTSARDIAARAMERTHRWAKRCKSAQKNHENALFGIVQGAIFEDLRKESAAALTELDFPGYAIGGLAVGETDDEREHFTRYTAALLPANKPRYLMGVGTPHDLVRSIRAGIDMFDCIIPTNHARQGVAYVPEGRGVFANLSVRENLVMAAKPAGPAGRCWSFERVLTTFPRLSERLNHLGGQLSGGEQQMLSIGRALMTQPELIILDEATEGLAPLIVAEIWRVIAEIRRDGIATLIVDRDFRKVLAQSDRAVVLQKGQVVLAGESKALRQRPELAAFLGV